jgi:hypothetical protein
MNRLALPILAVLCGCDATPLAPDRQPAFKTSSVVTVSARTQVVTLQFGDGETARASFKARFYASTPPGPTAQMDGAILVVSAADGPMPQIGGESLAIEVSRATLNRGDLVQFEGIGTVSTGRLEVDRYPISGSARPAPDNANELIWDIFGDDWTVRFAALTRIS